jgi:hypothetical protein
MNIVETVVDLEDRLAKEFENFQFMSRETGILLFFSLLQIESHYSYF